MNEKVNFAKWEKIFLSIAGVSLIPMILGFPLMSICFLLCEVIVLLVSILDVLLKKG